MIATFDTSIAGLLLYEPLLNETDYILGGEYDSQIALGALLEVLLIITAVGTAVVLLPVGRRHSEVLALNWVASRIIESAAIMVGIVAVLAKLRLRSNLAGADGESISVDGDSDLAFKDWSFVMGPGFCVAVGNGMILGYLMYRSGLLPRQLAIVGLSGWPTPDRCVEHGAASMCTSSTDTSAVSLEWPSPDHSELSSFRRHLIARLRDCAGHLGERVESSAGLCTGSCVRHVILSAYAVKPRSRRQEPRAPLCRGVRTPHTRSRWSSWTFRHCADPSQSMHV